MKDVTKLDFTGQPLYIGMDIHKKSWSVSIFSEQAEHKTYTQPPTVSALVQYLKRMFPGATYHAVYEAGFSGYWIHDGLQASGVQCRVVHPPDIPTMDKERLGKSDRVDCRKLGRELRNGQLQGIYIPPPKQREDRSLMRTRASMVRKQTRCKNQIISMLYFYGIALSEDMQTRRWSRAFIGWLETLQLQQPSGSRALRAYLDELLHLRQIIAQLNRDILQLSRTEAYAAQVRLLKTVPGISTLTAMILLTEIGDIARFARLDELASYTGLIPNTRGSGETEHTTGLTRRRNPMLRSVLIESAWVAARKDPALMLALSNLSLRKKKTKAIVQIARKLLNRIRFVLKNQQPYVPCVVA